MPTPFFQRLQLQPIHVAFEDIVPAASTAARVQQRAVYKDSDPQVAPFPQRCWSETGREPVASVSAAGLGRPLGHRGLPRPAARLSRLQGGLSPGYGRV